jgi:hypothetical protein
MADETPSSDNLPKKETVRITLPPKPADTPSVKRETVRINAPGSPKKETTNLPGLGGAAPAPKPFAPPPSMPKPVVPGSAPKPSLPGAPKPPTAPARPAAPVAAAAPTAATYSETAPVTMKAAAPKKETARIQVAPEARRAMPQATIRMQQTQPLAAPGTVPALRSAPAVAAATPASTTEDPLIGILSWAALAASLVAAALGYLAFAA